MTMTVALVPFFSFHSELPLTEPLANLVAVQLLITTLKGVPKGAVLECGCLGSYGTFVVDEHTLAGAVEVAAGKGNGR